MPYRTSHWLLLLGLIFVGCSRVGFGLESDGDGSVWADLSRDGFAQGDGRADGTAANDGPLHDGVDGSSSDGKSSDAGAPSDVATETVVGDGLAADVGSSDDAPSHVSLNLNSANDTCGSPLEVDLEMFAPYTIFDLSVDGGGASNNYTSTTCLGMVDLVIKLEHVQEGVAFDCDGAFELTVIPLGGDCPGTAGTPFTINCDESTPVPTPLPEESHVLVCVPSRGYTLLQIYADPG